MIRISNWETALSEYINVMRHVPFEYGINDCCMFAAGAVEAMTGIDAMAEFRGKYDSALSAAKALRDIGNGSLEATIDDKFPEVVISQAKRGDIALFDDSLGIVSGSFAWFVSDDGLERVQRADWQKTWSVGHG